MPAPAPAAGAPPAGAPRERTGPRPEWDIAEAEWRALGAEALKDKGTACYKKRRFEEAILWYSRGIVLAPEHNVLYGNRCAAMYELLNALADGNMTGAQDTPFRRDLLSRMVYDAEVLPPP